ncbi:hypothetical protein JXA47_11415 [Candidatus Sumerlaeota bacterium]|nr:hypothetical protein [Candidatus Sumerlaeota bacterium]
MPLPALTLLAMILTLVSTVRAELRIEAQIGFDGFYIPGEWSPIEVRLSNMPEDTDRRPPRNLEGQVIVRSLSHDGRPFSYTRDVDLPANSIKRIWLVIKASGDDMGTPPQIDVEFRASSRRARAATSVRGQPARAGSAMVLILRDENPLGRVNLPGVSDSQSYTLASVTRLPDQWVALSSVAAIFMTRNSAVNLGSAEIEALRTWLEQGGVLIVDGSAGSALAEAPIAGLLPVDVGEPAAWLLQRGNRFEPAPEDLDPLPENSVILLSAELREGAEALWELEGHRTLAAVRPVGLGRVAFIGWDLSSEPMGESARAMALLASLVPSAASMLNHERFHQLILQNINPDPSVTTPSVLLALLLLLGYWIVVGPVNYLFLSRRKMIELAWITIPALIALFCIGFYMIGALTRSNRDSLRHINVISARPGIATARADAVSLHFSAAKQHVDYLPGSPASALSQVTFWDDPAMAFAHQMYFTQQRLPRPGTGMTSSSIDLIRDAGDPASVNETHGEMRLEDQLLRQWTFAYLESTGPVDLGGTLEATAYLSRGGSQGAVRLEGSVTNRTDLDLHHAAIVWGNRYMGLGDSVIGAGETVTFDGVWDQSDYSSNFLPRSSQSQLLLRDDPTQIRTATLRALLLDAVELDWLNPQSGRPMLVAFADEALLAPEPDHAVERVPDHTLIALELPLEVREPTAFTLRSECLPLSYAIRATTDDSVHVMAAGSDLSHYDPTGQTRPRLEMTEAQVLITYRLPLAPTVNSEVTSIIAQMVFHDGYDQANRLAQRARLYALDRTASEGNAWIPIRMHSGDLLSDQPLSGLPQHLDASRVVDPITGEITLLIAAEPVEGVADRGPLGFISVESLTLTVSGHAWPAVSAAEQTHIPPEEGRI